MDLMADDLNIDPAVLRHRNLLTPEELPYRIGELVPGDPDATLDKGDYPSALDRLLTECRYSDWIDKQTRPMVNCDRWVLPVYRKQRSRSS